MARRNYNDMGFLGEDFQFKLVHEFMEDRDYFKDLCVIVDQNMFTDPNLRTYVGIMKEYYDTYDVVPTYEIMGIKLNERAHSEIEKEIYNGTLEKILNTPSDGEEYIKELAIKFFKQQNMIRVAHEILKIAGNGDVSNYDRCEELLNSALNDGTRENMGSGVFDNENETLSEDYRIVIPTGIGKIDETLEGGIGKGELGVIIGPSSFGKTSLTTAIASFAATYKCPQNNYNGFKVIQIVFEDRIKQIQRKHIGRITGIESKDLGKPEYKEKVIDILREYPDKDMLQNNLRIVRFPSGEKTAWDIERHIKKSINNGFKPDLVIIDYFECLEHKNDLNDTNEWNKEGRTMRKFESMAGDLNIGLWIPLQGTRESVGLDLVTMDKAGGSFKKIQIAHIVMSIARTNEDIDNNKATIAILKNRAGKAGKVFNNVEFNNGTCIISTDHVDELDSIFAHDKKQESDMVKLQQSIFKMAQKKNG